MWKNKKTQTFNDGDFTVYHFANENRIQILTKKYLTGYKCDVSWNFGKYMKMITFSIENDPLKDYDKKNKIKLKELHQIYNSLKKHKNKSTEKKLLLSALMIVIHDIKEQTYINQKLF